MPQRAIFLDRDGVLNDAVIKEGKPYPPSNVDEMTIPMDVLPALQLLKSWDFLLIGATNQPDVARGTTTKAVVQAINTKLLRDLPLDDMRVCYHDDKDQCPCRKPLPGLLLAAADEYDIDLLNSVMIGDRGKDIAAGQAAGCKTIWINRQYNEAAPKKNSDYIATSLMNAVMWIKENVERYY